MAEQASLPTFSARVCYQDVGAAAEWLAKAFGFAVTRLAMNPAGQVMHAELRFGDGMIDLGGEWEHVRAPTSVGGTNTQGIIVHLESGIEDHCERARAAGAVILQEPEDQFHGDRLYRAMDPEGHMWMFLQKIRDVTNQEMEAAMPGMTLWSPEEA